MSVSNHSIKSSELLDPFRGVVVPQPENTGSWVDELILGMAAEPQSKIQQAIEHLQGFLADTQEARLLWSPAFLEHLRGLKATLEHLNRSFSLALADERRRVVVMNDRPVHGRSTPTVFIPKAQGPKRASGEDLIEGADLPGSPTGFRRFAEIKEAPVGVDSEDPPIRTAGAVKAPAPRTRVRKTKGRSEAKVLRKKRS